MAFNEKVLAYEAFLNEKLRHDLKIVMDQRDSVYEEVAEYMILKQTIEKLKRSNFQEANVGENMKTQMDIGCSFYVQAVIPDPKRICVKIGYGFFAEFTLDEALPFIDKKVEFMNQKVENLTHQVCSIKAKIKIVLENFFTCVLPHDSKFKNMAYGWRIKTPSGLEDQHVEHY
uniref:Protein UXT n=1 Tax=Romanomermis culicivorax TaxID=13658 RepID=A0A915KGX2_ROMCU